MGNKNISSKSRRLFRPQFFAPPFKLSHLICHAVTPTHYHSAVRALPAPMAAILFYQSSCQAPSHSLLSLLRSMLAPRRFVPCLEFSFPGVTIPASWLPSRLDTTQPHMCPGFLFSPGHLTVPLPFPGSPFSCPSQAFLSW